MTLQSTNMDIPSRSASSPPLSASPVPQSPTGASSPSFSSSFPTQNRIRKRRQIKLLNPASEDEVSVLSQSEAPVAAAELGHNSPDSTRQSGPGTSFYSPASSRPSAPGTSFYSPNSSLTSKLPDSSFPEHNYSSFALGERNWGTLSEFESGRLDSRLDTGVPLAELSDSLAPFDHPDSAEHDSPDGSTDLQHHAEHDDSDAMRFKWLPRRLDKAGGDSSVGDAKIATTSRSPAPRGAMISSLLGLNRPKASTSAPSPAEPSTPPKDKHDQGGDTESLTKDHMRAFFPFDSSPPIAQSSPAIPRSGDTTPTTSPLTSPSNATFPAIPLSPLSHHSSHTTSPLSSPRRWPAIGGEMGVAPLDVPSTPIRPSYADRLSPPRSALRTAGSRHIFTPVRFEETVAYRVVTPHARYERERERAAGAAAEAEAWKLMSASATAYSDDSPESSNSLEPDQAQPTGKSNGNTSLELPDNSLSFVSEVSGEEGFLPLRADESSTFDADVDADRDGREGARTPVLEALLAVANSRNDPLPRDEAVVVHSSPLEVPAEGISITSDVELESEGWILPPELADGSGNGPELGVRSVHDREDDTSGSKAGREDEGKERAIGGGVKRTSMPTWFAGDALSKSKEGSSRARVVGHSMESRAERDLESQSGQTLNTETAMVRSETAVAFPDTSISPTTMTLSPTTALSKPTTNANDILAAQAHYASNLEQELTAYRLLVTELASDVDARDAAFVDLEAKLRDTVTERNDTVARLLERIAQFKESTQESVDELVTTRWKLHTAEEHQRDLAEELAVTKAALVLAEEKAAVQGQEKGQEKGLEKGQETEGMRASTDSRSSLQSSRRSVLGHAEGSSRAASLSASSRTVVSLTEGDQQTDESLDQHQSTSESQISHSTSESQVTRLTQELKATHADLVEMKEERDAAVLSMVEVHAALFEHRQALEKKSGELDDTRSRLKNKTAELEHMTTEVERISAELEMANLGLEERTSELEEKTGELEERNAELDEKTAELDEKTAELSQKTLELSQKTAELSQKTTELDHLSSDLAQTESDLQQAESDLAAQLVEIKRLTSDLESRPNPSGREDLATELAKLHWDQQDLYGDEQGAAQAELDVAHEENSQLRTELARLEIEKDELAAAIEAEKGELAARIRGLEGDVVREREKAKEGGSAKARETIKRLERKVEMLAEDNELLRMATSSAQTQAEHLKRKLKRAESQISLATGTGYSPKTLTTNNTATTVAATPSTTLGLPLRHRASADNTNTTTKRRPPTTSDIKPRSASDDMPWSAAGKRGAVSGMSAVSPVAAVTVPAVSASAGTSPVRPARVSGISGLSGNARTFV